MATTRFTVTMPEIVRTIQGVVSRSERSIRADLETLGIKPIGKRQCPQRYAANAPWRVLHSLGYPVAAAKLSPPLDTAASALNQISGGNRYRVTIKRKATR